jgi:hypothetical protein
MANYAANAKALSIGNGVVLPLVQNVGAHKAYIAGQTVKIIGSSFTTLDLATTVTGLINENTLDTLTTNGATSNLTMVGNRLTNAFTDNDLQQTTNIIHSNINMYDWNAKDQSSTLASSVNSTSAFQVLTAVGNAPLRVDTTNARVSISSVSNLAPGYALHVKGGSGYTSGIMVETTGTGNTTYAGISYLTPTGAYGFQTGLYGSAATLPDYAFFYNNTSLGGIIFGTQSAIRLQIDKDGILTALPTYSATVGATNRDLYIDNTGKFGYVSSLRKFKDKIVSLFKSAIKTENIYKLRPVSFRWKKDKVQDFGLIAEEVEKVMPELCDYDDDGKLAGVKYNKLSILLLAEVQNLRKEIDTLKRGKK